jgi:hypothetical protein
MAAAAYESRTLQTLLLPDAPVFPGCIAWSAHGQLAVGLERAVHVLDASFPPCDGDPRGARPSTYAFEPADVRTDLLHPGDPPGPDARKPNGAERERWAYGAPPVAAFGYTLTT